MSSLAKMHEQAVARYKSVASRLDRHKAVIGTTTDRIAATVSSALGGATGGAVDHYMGPKGVDLPEAMIGPVPIALAGAAGLTLASLLFQKEDWSKHIAHYANGLGGYAAGVETLRYLRALPAAA